MAITYSMKCACGSWFGHGVKDLAILLELCNGSKAV